MGRFFLWIESIIPYIMTYAQYKRTHRNTNCNLCFCYRFFSCPWKLNGVCIFNSKASQFNWISFHHVNIFEYLAPLLAYTYGRLQSYTLHVTLLYVWLGLCEYYRIYLICHLLFPNPSVRFSFNCLHSYNFMCFLNEDSSFMLNVYMIFAQIREHRIQSSVFIGYQSSKYTWKYTKKNDFSATIFDVLDFGFIQYFILKSTFSIRNKMKMFCCWVA